MNGDHGRSRNRGRNHNCPGCLPSGVLLNDVPVPACYYYSPGRNRLRSPGDSGRHIPLRPRPLLPGNGNKAGCNLLLRLPRHNLRHSPRQNPLLPRIRCNGKKADRNRLHLPLRLHHNPVHTHSADIGCHTLREKPGLPGAQSGDVLPDPSTQIRVCLNFSYSYLKVFE